MLISNEKLIHWLILRQNTMAHCLEDPPTAIKPLELISRTHFMSISFFYANDMDNHFFYDYEAGL